MSTLRCNNWGQSFPKLSNCLISQIRQTQSCLSSTSWMTSQRIFNMNNTAKIINSYIVSASYLWHLRSTRMKRLLHNTLGYVNYVHRLHGGPLFLHHSVHISWILPLVKFLFKLFLCCCVSLSILVNTKKLSWWRHTNVRAVPVFTYWWTQKAGLAPKVSSGMAHAASRTLSSLLVNAQHA